jgi:hypothetical protein
MRFMVLIKATPQTEAGVLPTADGFAKMDAFYEQLAQAGAIAEGGAGLKPSSAGARIDFRGTKPPIVTDGPFTETKELIAGFCVLQMKSKEEAIEWLSRAPFEYGDQIEIRPLYEAEDFAGIVLDEVQPSQSQVC